MENHGTVTATIVENVPSGVSANATDSHHSKEITPGYVNAINASKHDSGVIIGARAVLTPDRAEKRQNGRRMKNINEPMFTLTAQDRHEVAIEYETEQDNCGKNRC